jgi:membrane peptidoglycan carboxypeptidase
VLDHYAGPRPAPVVDAARAYLVTSILSDNDARTPAFGPNSPLKLSRPAAVKTGTTDDFKDNWTVGYTSQLVAGVWVGNADNTPMRGTTGLTGAAPIWHDFMEYALAPLPVDRLEPPPGVAKVAIAESGKRWVEGCPEPKIEDLVVAGSEPSEACAAPTPAPTATPEPTAPARPTLTPAATPRAGRTAAPAAASITPTRSASELRAQAAATAAAATTRAAELAQAAVATAQAHRPTERPAPRQAATSTRGPGQPAAPPATAAAQRPAAPTATATRAR